MNDADVFKELYESLFDEVRSVLMEDDPLGLIPIGQADDYDHVVPATMTRLTNASSPDEVRRILLRYFENYGADLRQDREPSDRTVQAMWQAWQTYLKDRPAG